MGAQTFHSRAGKAYLFDSVALVNVVFGGQEERIMTTGAALGARTEPRKCSVTQPPELATLRRGGCGSAAEQA